jgi:hypothetical protein
MFYYLYEYLLWLSGYSQETVPEVIETEEEPPLELNPHTFPAANFVQPINVAELETEQENVVQKKKRKN